MVKSTPFSVSRAPVNLPMREVLIDGVQAQRHATSAVRCSKAGAAGPNDQLAEAGTPDGVPVTDGPSDGLKGGADIIRRGQGVAENGGRGFVRAQIPPHIFCSIFLEPPFLGANCLLRVP